MEWVSPKGGLRRWVWRESCVLLSASQSVSQQASKQASESCRADVDCWVKSDMTKEWVDGWKVMLLLTCQSLSLLFVWRTTKNTPTDPIVEVTCLQKVEKDRRNANCAPFSNQHLLHTKCLEHSFGHLNLSSRRLAR